MKRSTYRLLGILLLLGLVMFIVSVAAATVYFDWYIPPSSSNSSQSTSTSVSQTTTTNQDVTTTSSSSGTSGQLSQSDYCNAYRAYFGVSYCPGSSGTSAAGSGTGGYSFVPFETVLTHHAVTSPSSNTHSFDFIPLRMLFVLSPIGIAIVAALAVLGFVLFLKFGKKKSSGRKHRR